MNPPENEDLARRLEQLRVELAAQASQIRRGSTITLVFGVFALGALGFYFYWGYTQFAGVLEHESVAGTVSTIVDDNIPAIRKSLEDEARKSAPVWAEGLSRQLRESLPSGRKKLEDYILDRTRSTLEQGQVLTAEQFTKFVRTNAVALRKDVADLSKAPELADSAVGELEKSLEAQLDTDLKANANELVYILTAFSDKLQKLAKNEKLDQTEAIERRLAMIARRFQTEKVATSDTVVKEAAGDAVVAPTVKATSPPKEPEVVRGKGATKPEAKTETKTEVKVEAKPEAKPEAEKPSTKPVAAAPKS
jgi:hypothetical protein